MSSSSCSWRASCFEAEDAAADETEGEEKIRQKMAMAIFSLSLSLLPSFYKDAHKLVFRKHALSLAEPGRDIETTTIDKIET